MAEAHILYMHETAQISGAENSLLQLVMNLDRSRFLPHVLLACDGPLAAALRQAKVDVCFCGLPRIRSGAGVVTAIGTIRQLIRGRGIALVHSNSIRTHLYASLAARPLHVPVIWHQRNLITDELIDPDRLFSFLADRIVCNSRAIARRFLRRGIMPAKVRVVYNGVDTRQFSPERQGHGIRHEFGLAGDALVIGMASRLHLRKGHALFFEAAEQLVRAGSTGNIRFLIAGTAVFDRDRWMEKKLKDDVLRRGLAGSTVFAGFRQDMPEVYAAMDIFVLAAEAEPCGRVVLEAMASGKPVVGTRSGGTPELVEDGLSGFLVGPDDAGELTAAMTRLVVDPGMRQRMGEHARSRAKEYFGIDRTVRQIQDIYQELL